MQTNISFIHSLLVHFVDDCRMSCALFCQVPDASAGKWTAAMVEHAGQWALRPRRQSRASLLSELKSDCDLPQRDRAMLSSTSNYGRSETIFCVRIYFTLIIFLKKKLKTPYYRRPHVAPAIAKDCYSLAVFYLFFISHHRFFDVPGPIFAKLPHDTVCSEIFYLLLGFLNYR